LAGYTYLLTHKHLVELHLQGMVLLVLVVMVARAAKGRRHHVLVSPGKVERQQQRHQQLRDHQC
jgi:heme exporter protein D